MNLFPVSPYWNKNWLLLALAGGLLAIDASAASVVPSLTTIFYLGDSYLDAGNYKALSNGKGPEYFSNGQPWCAVVDTALGLPNVGRWTSAGNHAPFGNNYSVAGSGINYSNTPTNTSLHGQVMKLLQDYPQGLPNNSLVVVAIGTNDVRAVIGFGGIWTTSSSEWRLGNAGFTVPALNATVTVSVTSTIGMTTGPMNLLAFPTGSVPAMLALIEVDPKGNTITLRNKLAYPGTKIPEKAAFEVCGKWFLDEDLKILLGDINSVVAKHGQIVLVLLPPTDMLPTYNRQSNQALVQQTWRYLYDEMRSLFPEQAESLLVFDLSSVFQDVFSDPTHYGFKVSYPGWLGTGSPEPNDYMFWDSFHPSASMHRYIAERFLAFLRSKGLIQ
jgi:lysophospholipase L1-like esterase